MSDNHRYDEAVSVKKNAILHSQYDAARSVNEKQLILYYGIGKYISVSSRNSFLSVAKKLMGSFVPKSEE